MCLSSVPCRPSSRRGDRVLISTVVVDEARKKRQKKEVHPIAVRSRDEEVHCRSSPRISPSVQLFVPTTSADTSYTSVRKKNHFKNQNSDANQSPLRTPLATIRSHCITDLVFHIDGAATHRKHAHKADVSKVCRVVQSSPSELHTPNVMQT